MFRQLREVYNLRDSESKARLFILLCNIIENIAAYLSTGIFYTAFLTGYNIDIVGIGVLSFVPYIACMLTVFAPSLLSHFKKRKAILAIFKLLYYFVNFVGLNLMPVLIKDEQGRLVGMIVITFLANLFNSIAVTGYCAWHISFFPDSIRAYCFTMNLFFPALMSGITLMVSSWITDSLASMGDAQLQFIIYLRYFCFILGVISVICLCKPREAEIKIEGSKNFKGILTIPLKNKDFMRTMLIVFLWFFSNNCYGSQFNVYLLNTIHVSYSFYNLIILLYSFFFLFCSNFWQKRIRRTSYFDTYRVGLLVVAPLQILFSFITPANYIILMLIVRLPQHFIGVGQNVAFSNFQYINMPDHDRECYSSFYQLVSNIGALSAIIFATVFASATQNWHFTLFGYTYQTGTPLLTTVSGIVQLSIYVYMLVNKNKLKNSAI